MRPANMLLLLAVATFTLMLTGCPDSGGDAGGGGGGATPASVNSPGSGGPAVADVKREGAPGTVRLPLGDENLMKQLIGLGVGASSRVHIDSPASNEVVRAGRVGVTVSVQDFVLGSTAQGQHVRLLLDDGRQMVVTDPSRVSYFEDVKDGWHVVTATLCRDSRLALKTPAAVHQVSFFVSTGTVPPPNLRGPVLVYSQPSGDYSKKAGEAKAILIDFQVVNVHLARDGHKVRATLDRQKTFVFESLQPQVISDLPLGSHSLKLELVAPDGRVVDCPVSPAEGVFRVVE